MSRWGRGLIVVSLLAFAGSAFANNGFEALKLSFQGREFLVSDLAKQAGASQQWSSDGIGNFRSVVVGSIHSKEPLFFSKYLGQDVIRLTQMFRPKDTAPILDIKVVDLPSNVHCFSFRERNFSPPSFSVNPTATPCLFFNNSGEAFIFSPASNLMTTRLTGDGRTSIGLDFNPQVKKNPGQMGVDALLVFAPTIHEAWKNWGAALRDIYHRNPVKDDQDVLLQKFGCWTDNGADYYYNYNLDRGYANTLLDLRHRYQDEGIPLGYMQLDSWWYEKSTTDAAGKFSGAIKNSKLPAGMWNRYGGLLEYKADPFLFPNGLSAFNKELGLPLATHNRWMDVNSPYRDRFKMSGVAAIDPAFWEEVASYLESSGVKCYEQDWLDRIYDNSPEMAANEAVGDAFTGGMAKACQDHGLTMQYCMATPRFMMQAVKYPNLTTIRTSDDRFGPDRWRDFIYASELANAVGARPWCDVYMSSETPNMILDVLSGGPVGTGDLMGKEEKANIMKAVRPDGVIVRPDTPLLPTDRTFINEAEKVDAPFVAETMGAGNSHYYFAFMDGGNVNEATLDLGPGKEFYLYNFVTREGKYVDSSRKAETLGSDGYGYWMVCPVDKNGATVLGDLTKFVPSGRNRLRSITEKEGEYSFTIEFAPSEKSVQVTCVGKDPVLTGVSQGTALIKYAEAATRLFAIEVNRQKGERTVKVKFRTEK